MTHFQRYIYEKYDGWSQWLTDKKKVQLPEGLATVNTANKAVKKLLGLTCDSCD